MTGQQLKNSILQWAIQGKLVPQIASEGTTEDLLKEIRAEKEKLVKEGKLKKKDLEVKPIEEDEIPFEIPEGWRWSRWGNLSFSIQYGYNAPAQHSGSIKMVRISDIHENKVAWETVPFCVIPDSEIENYKLQINDILFARTGGTVGKSFLVTEIKEDAIYAGYLIRTRFSKLIYPKFAKLFMETATYWNQLREGTIATAQPNCNGQTLSKMMIPIPPLSEQKRIVSKIEELMPLVEQYGKAQEQLEALNKELPETLKKSVLQEAIMGKLVPQDPKEGTADELLAQIRKEKEKLVKEGKLKKKDLEVKPIEEDEVPFEVPEGWRWCRWGDLSFSIQYGFNAPAQSSGTIKMVRISDIHDNKVSWDSVPYCEIKDLEIETYKLQVNDILFARTGGTVGKSFLVTEINEDAVYAGYLIRTRFSKNIFPKYAKIFMETATYWEQLREGTIATAQPNCNGQTLSKMMIPIPPLSEQKRIVAKIEEVMRELDKMVEMMG